MRFTVFREYFESLTIARVIAFLGVVVCVSAVARGQQNEGEKVRYSIAVHGGTMGAPDRLSDEDRAAHEVSLKKALSRGVEILADGGTSLDAVEQVIRILEDDPLFNAGKGAVLNSDGGCELDASIMDGSNRACGAVSAVKTAKNPISLARLVMTETRHVLLTAHGADRFAEEMGVERIDPQYFLTDRKYREWIKVRDAEERRREGSDKRDDEKDNTSSKGTVGCVALDSHGHLAAGTSTGGLVNKKFGRVGDSPIVGAGTYADDATCAVSCTGIGEHFIRNAIAFDVSARMAYKDVALKEAVREVIHDVLKPGYGGMIAVGSGGSIVADFNTPGMMRAWADSSGKMEVRVGR